MTVHRLPLSHRDIECGPMAMAMIFHFQHSTQPWLPGMTGEWPPAHQALLSRFMDKRLVYLPCTAQHSTDYRLTTDGELVAESLLCLMRGLMAAAVSTN